MKYSRESILKTLRTVDVLSHLSLSQLHRLSESVTEASYRKGDVVINQVTMACYTQGQNSKISLTIWVFTKLLCSF